MAQSKGNAVLLVGATVFVGYLFLTKRLQKVLQVLAEPAPGAESTPGAYTPQGQGGLGIPRAPWSSGIKIPTSGAPAGWKFHPPESGAPRGWWEAPGSGGAFPGKGHQAPTSWTPGWELQ